jgi:hypothetical protein
MQPTSRPPDFTNLVVAAVSTRIRLHGYTGYSVYQNFRKIHVDELLGNQRNQCNRVTANRRRRSVNTRSILGIDVRGVKVGSFRI